MAACLSVVGFLRSTLVGSSSWSNVVAKQSVARRATRPQSLADSLAKNCALMHDRDDDDAIAKMELTIVMS